VRSHDAVSSSFVAKLKGKTFAVKRHSSNLVQSVVKYKHYL
jgi:hypothetical protein